jgi:hypothetical protein
MNLGFAALLAGIFLAVAWSLLLPGSRLRGVFFAIAICLAALLPAVGYLVFRWAGYVVWSSAPFSNYSLVPELLSSFGIGAAVFILLIKRKLIPAHAFFVALASMFLMAPVAIFGGGFVACAMGDCF